MDLIKFRNLQSTVSRGNCRSFLLRTAKLFVKKFLNSKPQLWKPNHLYPMEERGLAWNAFEEFLKRLGY
jgi:hypothetical protein